MATDGFGIADDSGTNSATGTARSSCPTTPQLTASPTSSSLTNYGYDLPTFWSSSGRDDVVAFLPREKNTDSS